ncbi:4-oxalocrotonate tautomerase DmpI [Zhaonella formicivorans]|uniref:4-oxalocrotonate tautomerase DmpI n=1 Tax=Zhaonella formicivorans TaxID=2528593 RepID=UPI0010EBE4AA|nr:4-oxalocrotonate tautomerase DmpI [Zhaonella formicivorans]
MPIITFDGPKLTREQKANLVKEFTKIASQVTQIPEQAFVTLIREMEPDNVGSGGQLLSDKQK